MLVHFFIFKQKTAYELRISDWSSDVCSSDLAISLHDFLGFLGVFLGHLATGIALVLTHFLPRLGIVLTSFLTRGTIATVSIQNAGIGLGHRDSRCHQASGDCGEHEFFHWYLLVLGKVKTKRFCVNPENGTSSCREEVRK